MKKLLVMAVAALAFTATPVLAKEGFYIGAYFVPSEKISGSDETGSGYGFRAGLGFNRYFGIEGSYQMTEYDTGGGTADLKGTAVDAKINFPLTSLDSNNIMTLEPYIRGGYAIDYEFSPSGSSSTSGSGPRIGVGIELYLFKELSISGGWTRTSISFDEPTGKHSIRTFDVGLNYHFI